MRRLSCLVSGGVARLDSVEWAIVILCAISGGGAGLLACRMLRRCRRPAPVPAWCCAAGTGLGWAVVAWRRLADGWPAWWFPVPLVVSTLAVPLICADLRHRRLPDVLTLSAYPVLAVALGAAAVAGPGPGLAVRALLAALVFGGLHALVRLAAPAALGGGDVKLACGLGAVLGAVGWAALPVAAVVAAMGTVLLAAVAVTRRAATWRDGVPHGPGLLAATWLVSVFPGAGTEVGMGN
ncbi:prepilin peptidase [Amycolatopsis anabasis]|uniref:prepilin peptidase n=1 Tax=Amycolatopsis anabasis TaxID=1840409 RepID=UPI001FEB7651|nr:prepilin peptidase [Amycolatopsis anabasis]